MGIEPNNEWDFVFTLENTLKSFNSRFGLIGHCLYTITSSLNCWVRGSNESSYLVECSSNTCRRSPPKEVALVVVYLKSQLLPSMDGRKTQVVQTIHVHPKHKWPLSAMTPSFTSIFRITW